MFEIYNQNDFDQATNEFVVEKISELIESDEMEEIIYFKITDDENCSYEKKEAKCNKYAKELGLKFEVMYYIKNKKGEQKLIVFFRQAQEEGPTDDNEKKLYKKVLTIDEIKILIREEIIKERLENQLMEIELIRKNMNELNLNDKALLNLEFLIEKYKK